MNYKNKPEDMSDKNVNEWNEAYNSHLIPMYGAEPRNANELAKDKKYRTFMLDFCKGDTIKAVQMASLKGWHYFYKEIMDTAMFRFNQSWLLDSTYPASYFGYAAIKEYQGLSKDAERYYNLAYKHDPSDSLTKKYLHQIAQISEKHLDTSALINSYYRVLSRFPTDAIATGKLGYFYSIKNDLDSALKYFEITIQFDPNYEHRAVVYCGLGLYSKAIDDCSIVIRKNNKSIYGYGNRANALILNKQYDQALKDLSICVELDPKHPNFHLATALCYHELKDPMRTCEEIKKGISKGGKYADKLKEYNCQ
jgi:tetratricopeptide (TPR) repeat protein